jgi:hypothetical protein
MGVLSNCTQTILAMKSLNTLYSLLVENFTATLN